MSVANLFVLSVIFLVAIADAFVGLYLLVSRSPWLAHGAAGPWAEAAPSLWSGDARRLLESLFRRMGAFSFHTGAVTFVWAWMARGEPRWLTTLLVTYTITGLAFFGTDRAYFKGTRYFVYKQVLGGLWAAALVAQLVVGG
jgi:hypothetical protein